MVAQGEGGEAEAAEEAAQVDQRKRWTTTAAWVTEPPANQMVWFTHRRAAQSSCLTHEPASLDSGSTHSSLLASVRSAALTSVHDRLCRYWTAPRSVA